jgi:Ca2+-transporting ATPase
MAAEGLRVLLLARADFPAATKQIDHGDVSSGLVFLGLQGMIDPPRPESLPAVRACQQAGIQVKMITGDHAKTAAAIASMIGIPAGRALTGVELSKLDEKQLAGIVEDVNVYARVSPEQKLNLVNALQSRGHVVAMTGDGVNDAPALRRADIGVAMGIAGTEVAKEAADMVLTDDNFASIEAAVEEGRGVYDNLVKFIAWTLPTNGGEALVLLIAVLFGAQLPVLPVQLLWVNMATAVLLGIALVFEPKEPGLMARKPRPVAAPILDASLLWRIVLVSSLIALAAFGLFELALSRGESIAVARTVAVNTVVVAEVGYLFACRSLSLPIWKLGLFSNRWVWVGALVMLLAELAITYLPLMNRLFHTAPLRLVWWGAFTVVGGVVFALVELKKLVGRRTA